MLFTQRQEFQLKKAFAKVFRVTPEQVRAHVQLKYSNIIGNTEKYKWYDVTAHIANQLYNSLSLTIGVNVSDKRARLII